MSSIIGQLLDKSNQNIQSYLPLIWEKLLNLTLITLHSSIYKYKPISTKLGQNVCDHKISDEFDYRLNRNITVLVIWPGICKNC